MKKSIIGELIVSVAVALAACGALADGISFGDMYWLRESKWKDGSGEVDLEKSSFAHVYTGHSGQSPSEFIQIALFEVVGAKSKSEIKPIVENLGFAGSLSASVWTDEELRKKAMPPLSTASKWESEIRWVDLRDADDFSGPDGDYFDTFCWAADMDDPLSVIECEYESSKAEYGWPRKLWPENKVVEGRFWVAVELSSSASSRWYGIDGSIRVWQQGTNEKSERFYVGYDPDDSVPFATDAKLLFRGLTINTKFACLSAEVWDVDLVSYDAPLHAYWLETSAAHSGAPLSITLPESGILYLSDVWFPDATGITAKNADGQWSVQFSYEDDEAWQKYYEMGNENFFYEYGRPPYGSPGYIAVRVNSRKTITLEREDIDDDFDFFRVQFFPDSSKAVAVEASYFTIFDRNRYRRCGGNTGEYLQGYVTGTGVYKVGETVALTAVPAPGEAFDHWELKYGNFPAGIDTTNPTLSFTVTDDCAGTAEERKQMVVRAVWKEKRQITATAADISQGCATGSGFYHDGATPTLTAKPTARYRFLRWSDGVTTETRTVAVDGDAEYVAEFERREVPVFVSIAGDKVEGAAPTGAASEYNGYLVDAGGAFVGTVQVKLGKPGKKDGKASATATVQTAAGKKALKAADKGKVEIVADGPTRIVFTDGEQCEVVVGADGLSGHYGAYEIDGSRNFFASKDKSEANAAGDAIATWVGALAVVWDGGSASVTIDKKGKAKASVALSDGSKGTATSSLLMGDEWHCVPVMVTKKMNVYFALWLSADGSEAVVSGLGDGVVVGRTGTLNEGARFHVDVADGIWAVVSPGAYVEYLPDGLAVVQSGAKWTLPKAGRLAMKKGVLDDSKAGDNPSGLKLTLKKDGTFTGLFKVYYVNKDKLKSKVANITGIVINGVGYGTATIKGVGSISVEID